MQRNKNIAVITIGYSKFAFEDAQSALELMALMSRAVQVEHSYGMSNITNCSHFLSDSDTMPELKFYPASCFNANETAKEFKERYEREQADREDLDQQFKEAPPALPAPVVDDCPF